jgi:rod shape-determining protein MreC
MDGFDHDESGASGESGPPPLISMVLALAASVGLMMFDRSQDTLQPARNVLASLTYPLDAVASVPGEMASSFDNYLQRERLTEDNQKLREENLLLRGRLQKLAALQAENARIRSLLQSSRQLQDDVIISEVLATSPDPYRQLIKLNKGQRESIHVGQAVIDANGIMGQIVQAHSFHSIAILITDANHGIPVELNRTGLQTIAQGLGKSNQLSLPFLTVNTDIREGDLLVSSGLGERYPAGYPVARITRIAHQAGDEFLSIRAQPTASLNRGREALVVISRNTPPAEPGAQPAEDASPALDAGPETPASAPDMPVPDDAAS